MASFYVDSTSNRATIVTIALVLFLSWADPVAARFQDLVTRLCSQTLEMYVCRSCILSDRSIRTKDIPRLTYSAVFCVYSQAVYGHQQHADVMAQKATAAGNRRALKVCSAALLGASDCLWDTLTMVESGHLYVAYENLKRSRWSLVLCKNAYTKFANDATIPSPLVNDMALAKRLFNVVQYFFHLILKTTGE